MGMAWCQERKILREIFDPIKMIVKEIYQFVVFLNQPKLIPNNTNPILSNDLFHEYLKCGWLVHYIQTFLIYSSKKKKKTFKICLKQNLKS